MADHIEDVDIEEITASYEELTELEKEFDDVETEIIRQQVSLTKPLYEKREKLVAKIPNFWPLVFEQAPPEVDQYIQPTDSAVLLSSLSSISVSHFEIENGGKGDPRSVAIKMEFTDNEYFEDKVLEKKFWYRRSQDGDTALVSEPVPIKWKEGKDLTQGMLDLVVKVWNQDKKKGPANGESKKIKKEADYTPDEKALKEKIDATGLGAVSFFAWFGFRGLDISEEESRVATEEEQKKRAERAAGKLPELKDVSEEDEDEDDEEDPFALEIFPDGDELAIAFSDDLWPGAIKYFTQAQEGDILSDVDFEDDDEEMGEGENGEEGEGENAQPPSKKQKK
ncbi:nucleosome assembly protein [Whalleya microplaca]|nr:nucleosome assembly protein [Whalleya microplaca]